jgi:hypothetical protein
LAQLEQGRPGFINAPLNYYSIVVLAADTMALQQWNTRWLTGHQKGHNQIQKAASGYHLHFHFHCQHPAPKSALHIDQFVSEVLVPSPGFRAVALPWQAPVLTHFHQANYV